MCCFFLSPTVELKGIFYRGVKEDHCVELGRDLQLDKIGNSAHGIVVAGGWGCGEGVGYVYKECKLRKRDLYDDFGNLAQN